MEPELGAAALRDLNRRVPGSDPAVGRSWAHLRGHIFDFGRRPSHDVPAAAGLRVLLIVLFLEGVLGPRLTILSWLHVPSPPPWVRVPLLLGLAVILLRTFAGVRLSQVGMRPWREWTLAEKSYFLQVCVIANIVFGVMFGSRVAAVDPAHMGPVVLTALTNLLWGFYQELVYRGMLQSELSRRWGAPAGVLLANLCYTFGPLHYYHFSGSSPAPMFAGIFAIGLFFGIVYARSGNLWMVGTFHGIGDAYINGFSSAAKSP